MCVCRPVHMNPGVCGGQRHWIPLKSWMVLRSCMMWVLGMKLQSFAKASCALNHCPISPVLSCFTFNIAMCIFKPRWLVLLVPLGCWEFPILEIIPSAFLFFWSEQPVASYWWIQIVIYLFSIRQIYIRSIHLLIYLRLLPFFFPDGVSLCSFGSVLDLSL